MLSSGLFNQVFGNTSFDMKRSALWKTGFVKLYFVIYEYLG